MNRSLALLHLTSAASAARANYYYPLEAGTG
jgi:hypothetical protein